MFPSFFKQVRVFGVALLAALSSLSAQASDPVGVFARIQMSREAAHAFYKATAKSLTADYYCIERARKAQMRSESNLLWSKLSTSLAWVVTRLPGSKGMHRTATRAIA